MRNGACGQGHRRPPDDEPSPEHIVPSVFEPQVAPRVAAAVSQAAIEEGVVRLHRPPQP